MGLKNWPVSISKVFSRPGKQNAKADFLSRRPEHRRKKGEDGKQGSILRPENLTMERKELANELASCLTPVESEPGYFTIVGEYGIGKTTLV